MSLSFQKWKRDVYTLKRAARRRPLRELPPAMRRWFEIQRDFDEVDGDAQWHLVTRSMAEIQELIDQGERVSWDDLEQIVSYGWTVLMMHYAKDGVRWWLLIAGRAHRPKANDKEMDMLDDIVKFAGGDPERPLLQTGEDDEGDIYWTWPAEIQ